MRNKGHDVSVGTELGQFQHHLQIRSNDLKPLLRYSGVQAAAPIERESLALCKFAGHVIRVALRPGESQRRGKGSVQGLDVRPALCWLWGGVRGKAEECLN